MNPVQIDTTQAATDSIACVVTAAQVSPRPSTRTVSIEAPSIVTLDDASTIATTMQ